KDEVGCRAVVAPGLGATTALRPHSRTYASVRERTIHEDNPYLGHAGAPARGLRESGLLALGVAGRQPDVDLSTLQGATLLLGHALGPRSADPRRDRRGLGRHRRYRAGTGRHDRRG